MEKYEIAVLTADFQEKEQRFRIIGMMNSFGLDAAEQVKLHMKYEEALIEMIEAQRALREAMRK